MKKGLREFRLDLLHRSILCALCSQVVIYTTAAHANGLPPPPRNVSEVQQLFKLYLDLVVNGYPSQQVIPIIVKEDRYYIEKSRFSDLNIQLPAASAQTTTGLSETDIFSLGFSGQSSDWMALDQWPDIQAKYHAAQQYFSIDLPAAWMPTQVLGRDSWYQPETAGSGTGFLNNYDFYHYKPSIGRASSTLFTEQRIFSPYGVFKNSGIYYRSHLNSTENQTESNQRDGYRRYDTTWQYDDPEKVISFLAGDIISASKNSWGSAIRLGGLQLQRNFGTRPDLITYPLPQFQGQADVPSTVDLLINGQKANSTEVQSGPFILNNVPFINGKGEAVIVTRDSVGRQVSTAVPFYIANTLLKEDLFDYAISAGQIREDYGIKNFSYGSFAASADARYGVNSWLTAEGRSEFSNDVQVLGLGAVMKLQQLGVLSASLSHSWANQNLLHNADADQQGFQYTLGYSYNQSRFGFSVNHSNRDQNFADLSHLQNSFGSVLKRQQSTVANAYVGTQNAGTFGLAYIQAKSNDIENKLMNVSWAPVMPAYMRGATVSLSSNYNFIEKDWRAAFQLSIPLGGRLSTANMGYSLQQGGDSAYINYNRAVPTEGGVGVDLTHRYLENGQEHHQGRLSYRNRYLNTDVGISGYDDYNYWLGVSGSLVMMSGNVFATNRLGESFALVDTNNVADVPVLYENNLIGYSNRNGYVFVPSVTPYYAVKYSINPLDLASNYNATSVESRQAAKRGSGILVQFPIKKSYAANVHLLLENGQVVPTGAVIHRAAQASSYVGMDGIAYLEDLSADNQIRVQLPNESLCTANFKVDLAQAEQQILVIKAVTCHEVNQP